MSDAVERMREALKITSEDGEWALVHAPDLRELLALYMTLVGVDDLRALLDAHEALEAAHTEALDALSDIMTVVNGEESGGVGQVADATNAARAVLAKAGRR